MINLIVNGNSYSYPQPGDKANTGWGSQGTNWASAVTAALAALGLGGTLTPTPNAVVDISSTTKGILVPRLTTTQRNAITSPATSLLIFNTTLGVFQYYTGSAWITIGAKIPDNVQFDGTLIVGGNISTNGSISAVGSLNGASVNITGLTTSATGNFTDTTDATNSDTAPLKTLGGMAVKKKLFVGTDIGIGGNANVTGDANITGKALTGNGLVGAPSHSFVNDPNSGLYRISEDKIGFAANGIRQGEFGIGYGGFTGNIIQVVQGSLSTYFTTSNTGYVDISTGLMISITPRYNTSKILILGGLQGVYNSGSYVKARILRDVTEILVLANTSFTVRSGSLSINYLDSPATINQITYKIQVGNYGAGGTTYVNDFGNINVTSTILALEVQQ